MPENQFLQTKSDGSLCWGGASLVQIFRISCFVLITLSLFFLSVITLSDSLPSFSLYTLKNVNRLTTNFNWLAALEGNSLNSTRADGYSSYKQLTNQQSLKTSNISILFFSYAKEHTKTNLKSECKLQYNCVFTHDGYSGAKKWANYSAVMVYGFPGLQRFRSQFVSTGFNREELFHLILLFA
ncbi:uncharacterized protein LOC142344359 [Convolutriloba macropyga]|uniref:uncharacterized protein LOC142344359 n=1 Tax=Convolutriloba macropyga TaxID=536237 RepID=UPI003F51D984